MLALHDFMTFMFLEFSFLARWASEDRNIEKLRRSSDWIEQNPSSVVKPANLPNVVARPWAKSRNEPHGWDRNQTSVEAASPLNRHRAFAYRRRFIKPTHFIYISNDKSSRLWRNEV